jgi:hypothetical protein
MKADVFLDSNVILHTGDLSDGQEYDGVKAVNPFRGLG